MAEKKKENFTCRLCGNTYETINECIKCESECLLKSEREESLRKEQILKEEKAKKVENLKDQIRMLKENEESLSKEYWNTVSRRKSLESTLYNLQRKDYGYLFDFFNF